METTILEQKESHYPSQTKSSFEVLTEELVDIKQGLDGLLIDLAPLDQSFDKLVGNVNSLFSEAISYVDRNKRQLFQSRKEARQAKELLQGIGELSETGIRGIQELTNEYRRNSQLDKMLQVKEKMAASKLEVTENFLVRAEKNTVRFQAIFQEFLDQEYDLNELKQNGLLESQIRQMDKVISQYRLSLFCYRVINYMVIQFRAWKNGLHENPDFDKPDSMDINFEIINGELFPMSDAEAEKYLCSPNCVHAVEQAHLETKISAPTLFMLVDDQLYATYLQVRSDAYAHTKNNQVHQFEEVGKRSGVVREILLENKAYIRAQDSYYVHKQVKQSGEAKLPFIHLKYIFLLLATYLVSLFLIDTPWVKYTVGASFGLYFLLTWRNKVRKYTRAFQYSLHKIMNDMTEDLFEIAGYEYRQELDYEKKYEARSKAVLGGILGAIFGFFVIPIPGGLLIGLILGAIVGAGYKPEEVEA